MAKYTETDQLHFAVQEHQAERVKEMLRTGADVNTRDRRGATPLMVAARWGHNDLIQLLIEAGAKVDAKDRASPVEYGRRTALYHACMLGRISTVRLLLGNGADPDSITQGGHTPLSDVITIGGNKDIIRLLLEHGANPDGPEKCFEPPVVAAAGRSDLGLLTELLKRGADPNRTGSLGELALGYTSSVVCARLLLQYGARVNLRNAEGHTPLFRNLVIGRLGLLKCYIEAGADVNVRDKFGVSALMRLAEHPRIEVGELLVSSGADINATVGKSCSTLDYIANFHSHYYQDERRALLDYLVSKGAKSARELRKIPD